jgi:molecular chaperone DnaJ
MQTVTPCGNCRGEGRIVQTPCVTCRGQGRVQEHKTIEVQIPAGVDEDVQVRVASEGEAGPRGGPAGDLYLGFRVAPHPVLVRRDFDLVYELPITIAQAVLGDQITVPTVNGEHILEVVPGTQDGKVLKIPGMGVPHIRSGRRGDQLCVVRVVIPTKLTPREKEIYDELGNMGGRSGRPAEVHKGFFSALKDAIAR